MDKMKWSSIKKKTQQLSRKQKKPRRNQARATRRRETGCARNMDVKTILIIILLIIVVIAAIFAIELRDLIYASIALAILSIALAAVFWILNAPWVALFQLMIYVGAVTVLLISTVALTERFESGEPVEELDKLVETEESKS